MSILGNGVVIDPWALLNEIDEIKKKGVDVTPDNFMISESASLILPFHQEMDEIRENAAGKEKLRNVFCWHGYALKRLVFSTENEVSLAP